MDQIPELVEAYAKSQGKTVEWLIQHVVRLFHFKDENKVIGINIRRYRRERLLPSYVFRYVEAAIKCQRFPIA